MDAKGRAVIGDLDAAKTFNSLSVALRVNPNSTFAGTLEWMSPEMRKSYSRNDINIQLPKSDIFSLGLIALYCLDTIDFKKKVFPIMKRFILTMQGQILQDYLDEFELILQIYLDEFWIKRCSNPTFFYMLRSMLSFSPSARPNLEQLYNDFPKNFPQVKNYIRNLN